MSTTTVSHEIIPTGTWVVDPVHSQIGFQVNETRVSRIASQGTETRQAFSTSSGRFTQFEGRLEGGEQPSFAGTIRVDSLRTDTERRAAHLISPAFLDAAKHREIRFESTAVEPLDDERFTLRGNLFVKDTPFEVEFEGRARARCQRHAGAPR